MNFKFIFLYLLFFLILLYSDNMYFLEARSLTLFISASFMLQYGSNNTVLHHHG